MYKGLSVINGILLAVMIFLNGQLAHRTGTYVSTLIFHAQGLLLLGLLRLFKKGRPTVALSLSPILFIPGLLSVMTIAFNNITIPRLGVTLASGTALFGQLVMSAVVEHFGLFDKQAVKLKPSKGVGFLVILLGIFIMLTW